MYKRRIFTTDPDYFPTSRMREIVDYLHAHDQKFGAYVHLISRGHNSLVCLLLQF